MLHWLHASACRMPWSFQPPLTFKSPHQHPSAAAGQHHHVQAAGGGRSSAVGAAAGSPSKKQQAPTPLAKPQPQPTPPAAPDPAIGSKRPRQSLAAKAAAGAADGGAVDAAGHGSQQTAHAGEEPAVALRRLIESGGAESQEQQVRVCVWARLQTPACS